MDLKLPHSLLKDYLQTDTPPSAIAEYLSLCGPTVDRLETTTVDAVYHLEVITNRVDSASAFGVAREAAAILPQFDRAASLINNPYDLKTSLLGRLPTTPPAAFQILDEGLLPRLSCIALTNVTVSGSAQKTKKLLDLSGLRPLNNVVDISNELTLRFGLPVHIFDLDKITNQVLTLRESKKGEAITTLDGQTHLLPGKDIVITDASGRLIDLCGVMGGQLSQVDESTKNILLFVPVYEPRHIRHTSLSVQNRSLAAQIYEKGPDPLLTLPTLVAGVQLLQERAGAQVSSSLFDYFPNPRTPVRLQFDPQQVNHKIGDYLPPEKQTEILKSLGFVVKPQGNHLRCTVPSWRHGEVTIVEDLVEEIARIYGYYRLKGQLPPTTDAEVLRPTILDWETKTKHFLTALSYTEILSSSLTNQGTIKLTNPLSADYAYLRDSLIPGLLSTAVLNRQASPLHLFELSNVYLPAKSAGLPAKKLPDEHSKLAMLTTGLDYRTVKGHLEALGRHLKVDLNFTSASAQTATVSAGKHKLGQIGLLDPQLTTHHQLDQTVIVDLDFAQLADLASPLHAATPLPKFASVIEDVTIKSNQPIADIIAKIKTASKLITNVTYLTSLNNKHTFRLEFNHPSRNLTQREVNSIKSKL